MSRAKWIWVGTTQAARLRLLTGRMVEEAQWMKVYTKVNEKAKALGICEGMEASEAFALIA